MQDTPNNKPAAQHAAEGGCACCADSTTQNQAPKPDLSPAAKLDQARVGRRQFMKYVGAGVAGATVFPHLWIKNQAIAQTDSRGKVKHLLYVRLSGGFRFTAAFNAAVSDEFSPFGVAEGVAPGAQWGVSKLFEQAPWLEGDQGAALAALGLKPVTQIADQITVLPCVDHEPLSGNADGNHGTGFERFLTGYVGGETSFFTMINYGLRERVAAATAEGKTILPAFVLGSSGMSRGIGPYAAYRPPLMQDGGFDRFGFNADEGMPDWATRMTEKVDQRMMDRQHIVLRDRVDAYIRTRIATKSYNEIFQSPALRIRDRADDLIDGISNPQLAQIFGDNRDGQNVRLALRLFHFGCPAVYIDQGGYDMHSGEMDGLPGQINGLARIISGLEVALKIMQHPDGGTYWDHTLIVMGSEFGRTARGGKFNSARGSDHGGDYATRWMSMPVMGGPVSNPGQQLGAVRPTDLKADGQVYSYRSMLKTLLDGLGADHSPFFPADPPFNDFYA